MSKPKDGGPAFPETDIYGNDLTSRRYWRRWYAGMAMNGLIASTSHPNSDISQPIKIGAIRSVAFEMADAMLAHEQNESE